MKNSFLAFVTRDLYAKHSLDLHQLVVVLPTRRAALFVKEQLGELAGDRPVCTPDCTTISDLISRLCPLKAAEEVETVCLLYNIYKEEVEVSPAGKELTLDAFYGWGRQLIADFTNIDKAFDGTPVDNILQSAMEARHFDESNIDPEVRERIKGLMRLTSSHAAQTDRDTATTPPAPTPAEQESFRKEYEALWRKLPVIYKRLNEALALRNCAMEGARFKWVAEHIDTVCTELKEHTIAFVGFNQLLNVERTFMRKLKERDMALFYWDYNCKFDEQEPNINAYKNVRLNIWRDTERTMHNLGGIWQDDDTDDDIKPDIELIATASSNAQARYVATWLKAHHSKGQRTAIVICDESQLEHVAWSIPSEYSEQVNITKGYPLRNTPVFAHVVKLLNKVKSDQTDFLHTLKKLLDKLDESQSANSYDETADWTQILQQEATYQTRLVLVRFIQLLEEGLLDKAREFRTLRNLIIRHLSTVSIPFHGEPITDIQIIGVLETRALDFDNVLLLNVEEGILPRTSNTDHSFIPYYLRKYYHLPTNDEQTEIYAYNFFRLMRRATHVTIMYSHAQTAEGQKTMSRFVMQMLCSDSFSISAHRLNDRTTMPRPLADTTAYQQLRNISPYNNYAEKLTALPSVPKLSPSAINTFLTCRMKFFIRYMLGIAEPETTDSLLQANQLGTLIHESAELAYKKITNNYSRPLSPQAIHTFRTNQQAIIATVDEAFRKLLLQANSPLSERLEVIGYRIENSEPKAGPHSTPQTRIEHTVAATHLLKILTNDEQTPGLDIISCETDAYYTAKLHGLSLQIGGRIDRIDTISQRAMLNGQCSTGNAQRSMVNGQWSMVNGQRSMVNGQRGAEGVSVKECRIVDYKTGHYDHSKITAPSLESLFTTDSPPTGYILQTLIYSLALSQDTARRSLLPKGVPFYPILLFTGGNLASNDPHLIINGEPLRDFQAIKPEFEQHLCKLVSEILSASDFPMATASGSKSPCRYCKYSLLCGRT